MNLNQLKNEMKIKFNKKSIKIKKTNTKIN